MDAYAWGYNNAGGLGIGSTARALLPVATVLPAGTVDVQGGTDFTVALTSSGHVWTWGGNRYGQLGDGTSRPRLSPQKIRLPGAPRVAAIAVGQDHVVALTRRGRAVAWGRNTHGQLGDGSLVDRGKPVHIPCTDLAQVAAGNTSSVAITASGAVLTCGRTGVELSVGSVELARLRKLPLPRGAKAVMVAAGQRHIVVLARGGALFSFGVDPAGAQLPELVPLKRRWARIETISAGDNHTAALTKGGEVLVWGANYHGQVGVRDRLNRPSPVEVRFPKLRGRVVTLVASGDSVLAATKSHHVYAWGRGVFGQNGNGSTEDLTRPQLVDLPSGARIVGLHTGRNHCIALTKQH